MDCGRIKTAGQDLPPDHQATQYMKLSHKARVRHSKQYIKNTFYIAFDSAGTP